MEEKLKQSFVGKKYEIFEKKVFSFPTFFFGAIYFAYRKMFGKALILTIILNLMYTSMFKFLKGGMLLLAVFCLNTAIALFFPLWYKSFYNKAVKKIITNNPGKSEEELVKIAENKGGTSILFIILFFIINSMIIGTLMLGSVISFFIKGGNELLDNITIETNGNFNTIITEEIEEEEVDLSDTTLIEKVKVNGFMSTMNHQVFFESLVDEEYDATYTCSKKIFDAIHFLNDYDVYLNIYVTKDEEPVLVDYVLYNEKTDEEIKDITDEKSIREYFGLYIEGEYEEELVFVKNESNAFGKPGMPSVGITSDENGDKSYSTYDLLFKKLDDTELRLEYVVFSDEEDRIEELVENEKYKVKFEVIEGAFDYEYKVIDFSK